MTIIAFVPALIALVGVLLWFDRPRILVIDDEPDFGEAVQVLLEDEYDVCVARSGTEALRILDRGYVPDLVLSDVCMPKLSGLDLLPKLRERLPTTPILVISAGFGKQPGVEVLDKVCTAESLSRIIREHLP